MIINAYTRNDRKQLKSLKCKEPITGVENQGKITQKLKIDKIEIVNVKRNKKDKRNK